MSIGFNYYCEWDGGGVYKDIYGYWEHNAHTQEKGVQGRIYFS